MVVVINRETGKRSLIKLLRELRAGKGFDAKKHCGRIKLKESPVTTQQKMRDEWE